MNKNKLPRYRTVGLQLFLCTQYVTITFVVFDILIKTLDKGELFFISELIIVQVF